MLIKLPQQYAKPSRFWLNHIAPAFIFMLLMALVYPQTQLDTRITDLFFDAQLHRFTLKNDPFLTVWMHVRLKWLMVATALASLALALCSYRLSSLNEYRQSLLWVFAGMVISTTAVSVFKHYSVHGCPWDIVLYGGRLPLLDLFTSPPAGTEAGACFPAGHPSGGFALMTFYFAFMHKKPRFSVLMLWIGMFMGLLMGLVQVMRGAHFLSHVLWSGWLVWMVLLALYWLWPLKKSASRSLYAV
ncbi:MAG TPA: phosphatase PAP2 family protein [Methylotenera sp.]|nr:phosphatase PAP2 family protein [Methylotenera sp.]